MLITLDGSLESWAKTWCPNLKKKKEGEEKERKGKNKRQKGFRVWSLLPYGSEPLES